MTRFLSHQETQRLTPPPFPIKFSIRQLVPRILWVKVVSSTLNPIQPLPLSFIISKIRIKVILLTLKTLRRTKWLHIPKALVVTKKIII